MGETPIAPWQIMKAAHDAEFDLWKLASFRTEGGLYGGHFKRDGETVLTGRSDYFAAVETEFKSARDNASWRAALRALAEMEPTEKMKKAAEDKWANAQCNYSRCIQVECPKVWVLAAAAEGEHS